MSHERMTAGAGLGTEAAVPPGAAEDGSGEGIPTAVQLQILSAEHWSLLASRSLAWNESFSRAGMYLSTLSGAIVALALVAQASSFGQGFLLFAIAILPVVLFVGVATFIRLGVANTHDGLCVVGMNRIRAAYLEVAPELRRYFVMGSHDDMRGVAITMAVASQGHSLPHFLAATPAMVSVLNSVVAAAIASLAALQIGAGTIVALGAGALGFLLSAAGHAGYAQRSIQRDMATVRPIFSTPDGEDVDAA